MLGNGKSKQLHNNMETRKMDIEMYMENSMRKKQRIKKELGENITMRESTKVDLTTTFSTFPLAQQLKQEN